MSPALEVAVLGAGGTIAAAIVRDLAESPEVAGMRLLDLDADRAARAAADHGCGKARSAGVDARDVSGRDGLAAALADCDVLVNAASYRVNLEAMESALRAGCHYVDLGGLYWMTARQRELNARFERAALLALLGMGASPGKTNVMAVRAVRELSPDAVDEIRISAAGRDPETIAASQAGDGTVPLRVPYALQTLLDEVTMPPVVLDDGAPAELEPLAPGGAVEFPAPIGSAETIHTLHSELQTFGDSFGCRRASFRLSLTPALVERLEALAHAEPTELAAAAAATVPPSARTVAAHLVEAYAPAARVRVSALTVPHETWALGGGLVSTAAPAAAAVRLLARGRISARGVLPPEACVEPDDLFPELERRGCTFEVRSDTGAAQPSAGSDRA